MKKKILALLILVAGNTVCFSQQTIYFSKDSTTSRVSKKHSSTELNIIKISPLSFLFGVVPFYYEREIKDFFSVQAGIGLTTRNYLKEWANNLEFNKNQSSVEYWNSPNSTYSSDNSGNEFGNRKASIGYYFQLQPRIYFESDGLEGSFIAFSFENTRYNFSSRKVITGQPDVKYSSDYFKEYNSNSDVAVNFGNQTLYDRISVEYTAGIALRSKKGKQYIWGYDDTGNVIDGYSIIKKSVPAFLFSFKIGYHF